MRANCVSSPSATRICRECKVEKPLDDKHFKWRYERRPKGADNDGPRKRSLDNWCRDCFNAYTRRRMEDPERKAARSEQQRTVYGQRRRENNRRHWLARYGLTEETYAHLLAEHNGACKICGRVDRELHVDHCHATGKIRGMLCPQCNRAIGLFGDDPEVLASAIEYLRQQ